MRGEMLGKIENFPSQFHEEEYYHRNHRNRVRLIIEIIKFSLRMNRLETIKA